MATLPTSPVPQADLQLEIAHLLLIDIVGYSKLLINEQIESVQELGQIVRSAECFRKAEESGKLIRVPTGDGMALLFFRSPEEPVRCALEISQKVKENPNLHLRMGIHSGPVNSVKDVNDTLNVAGPGINVAQRVMDCGDAGHILLSKHVADDLAQYRHWQPYLRDLGEYEVKHGLRLSIVNLYKEGLGNPNLPEKLQRRKHRRQSANVIIKPVRTRWSNLKTALIFSVGALAIATSIYFGYGRLTRFRNAAAVAPEKSIAVLPFENRSEEKANAYFADGIQDEILTRLAKISELKVISRTSTQQYKSAPENLREIAKQLGVTHIVEGSVQKSGDAVRVNVQLINAANDTHVWADTFDRKLTDIFSVESDIAKTIADQLRAKLTGQESQVIAARPTESAEAYDAYLRALAYIHKPLISPGSTLAAERHLRDAVRLDPKFALGWALLAYVDAVRYLTYNSQPTAVTREEIRQAAETALSLQPNLGEALLAKGYYYYACLRQYDEAVRYFEKAREVLPNSSRVAEFLAYVARRQGNWTRSDSEFNEAEHLDPRNVSLLTQHALLYVALRRFSEADRKLDQVLDINPGDLDTLAVKGTIAQAQGDLARASAILESLQPTADHSTALQIKVYQQILERRPSSVIHYLKQILSKQDSALGYINGQLQFWLGWAEEVNGDRVAAQQSWREARRQLQLFHEQQPENVSVICDLALIDAKLGDRSAALDLLEHARAALPIEKDAVDGPVLLEVSSRVAAENGRADEAIAVLQKLLATNYTGLLIAPLTPNLLRLDPTFDQIRTDPRFANLTSRSASISGK